MNKNKKKILILLIICVIALLIYKFISIYAIFYSQVSGNLKFENGTWNIIVNGTEISKGTQVDFVIDNINIENDKNVKKDKIAPGLGGDFAITINPKDTDVSVKYEITLDKKNLKESNFLGIKSIKEIQANNEVVRTGANTYTGVIPLDRVKARRNKHNKI